MKEYSYQQNEWAVIYVDECGERQLMQFDLFQQANEFMVKIRENGCCIIGITTSCFYDNCVK